MRSRSGGPGPLEKSTGPDRVVANARRAWVTGERRQPGSAEVDDPGPQAVPALQLRQPADPAPSGPGPTGTAERLRRLEVVGRLIDHYRACAEPLREGERALERGGEHGRLKPQLAGVGDPQDLLVGPGGDHRQYRAEALLLSHKHLRGDPVEQRVLVVQGGWVATRPAAAEQQLGPSAGRVGQ